MINTENYMLRLFNTIDNRLDFILNNPYISGMGFGYKTINNKTSNIPTLTFLVKRKLSSSEINPYYRIPKYVNGTLTDVMEDGNPTLLNNETRPAYAGLSVSNSLNDKMHGTLTYAVTDIATKKDLYILSCSHVLDSTLELNKQGKDIMQPAVKFDGVPPRAGMKNNSYIGELRDSTPIKWTINPKDLTPAHIMEIDAAIAYVGPNNGDTRRKLLSPFFMLEGASKMFSVSDVGTVKFDDIIWTITANSPSRKYCKVVITNVVQNIAIENKHILLKNQIKTTIHKSRPGNSIFLPGDSGGLGVIDGTSKAFGMIISGSANTAYFSPIAPVLERFKVTFAKPTDGITETN